MAEHLESKDESTANPCCSEWKDRFLKLQQKSKKTDEARTALKKAIGLYERQLNLMQDENLKLKKAYEEEKLQTDHERRDKAKESAARVSLENEISALKSEIVSLSKKEGSVPEHVGEELTHLRSRVCDKEKEINGLRERLQKETSVAAADRTKAMEEKKRADEAWESAKADKSRADKELSNLKAQLHGVETEKKQLRKDLQKEKARADSEKKRADEALKAAKTEQDGEEVPKAEKKNAGTLRGMARDPLPDHLSSVKPEDLLLQNKGSVPEHVSEELKLLRSRVCDKEKEINGLRERLQKETSVAAADRTKAMEEKKRADEAWESAKAEKSRADKELSNLKAQLHGVETEKKQLRKDLQKEKARADSEKKRADEALKAAKTEQDGEEVPKAEKKNEETLRGIAGDTLPDHLSFVKPEDLLLLNKGHSGDQNLNVLTLLKGRVSEMETEISRLKELLDKEKRRADSEAKKSETEKKKANKTQEILKAEQCATAEQRRLVDIERKKAEESGHQLERLKCEADEARSKLVSESSKFKEANKKLEAEKKKLMKEKKKAEEQQKIAEMSTKNTLEEKQRADHLYQQLEESQQKYLKLKKEMEETLRNVADLKDGNQGDGKTSEINAARPMKNPGKIKQKANQARNCADLEMEKAAELKKAVEMYRVQAMAEKSRADKLAQQLEEAKQRTRNSSKEIQDIIFSRNSTPSVPIQKDMKVKSAEMKLLKKKLKFEKERVRHANQVAELERACKKAVEEELHRLKVEFAQFSNRIGLCSCFAPCNNDDVNPKRNFFLTEAYPLYLQSGKELLKPTCAATKSTECFKPSVDCTTPSLPISGTCTESTSGTASKLEPLLGGSNRKKLDSSALVSSMASFSDRQLVGSQGKCGFSNIKVAQSAKENSNLLLPVSRLASEANRTNNDAVVADNNVKTSLRVRTKDGNTKKRKRLLNAIESIEHLYTEGKTWHTKIAKNISTLHGILGHTDKPLKEGTCSDYNQLNRKRDMHFEEPVRPSCNSTEQKGKPGLNSVGDEDAAVNPLEDNRVEATHTCNNVEIFKRVFDGDYMKLLNLDNVVEEECYRAAVERPLSPTLPVIQSESNQSDDIVDPRLSIVNSSDIFKNGEAEKSHTLHVTSACISQAQDSIVAVGISDSGDKRTKNSCGNEFGSAHGDSSQYVVVFPETRDSSSLSKMFHATSAFTTQCCAFPQTDYVVKSIVSTISADKVLSPKEKVCVFFSVFLKSFSGIALTDFRSVSNGNYLKSINIFSTEMKKVMSNVETRTMFTEVCKLDELITLIENFIIDGRVLVSANASFEPLPLSNPEVNILLNDKNAPLSFHKASPHQLVLGAALLASFCEASDRMDSICTISYAISRDITGSSTLTFLHVFAYICGEKLFAHGDYSLIMTVIKSLVTHCERENLSLGFSSCTKCPFSEGAVSMEELALLLLERLRSYASCVICKGDSVIRCVHEFGMTTYKSKTVPDGTLSNLGDVLSLLELLASKMSWSWVCENIISQLFKLLEACVIDTSLSAIFVLLGQIARLGIDAKGFQDTEIENIRVKLSSFISQSTPRKFSLPVQFAAVNALLGTIPLSFQDICKNIKEPPPLVSPSTPSDCIHKWFSLLNDDQKSLAFRLLAASVA